ncbi:MAG TPA: alpha/beta fold hydrolase [Gemmatimonadaceae bacterium]|nr:alpha/beta fold hydrolase [Gemmatimonadaceae bacterium]
MAASPTRSFVACESFVMLIAVTTAMNGQSTSPASAEQASVNGGSYRLQTTTSKGARLSASPVLLVVLHGDSPFRNPDYQNVFAARAAAANADVVAVAVLRPGYTDPQGHKSDGERGITNGDNYNATNTDAIADAIVELKRKWHARKVVVAGHSGGAAITANILGTHPAVIDAALLVSCPCDVEKWRQHMYALNRANVFQGRIATLSPIEVIGGISARATIAMIVGAKDDVAPPDISTAYQTAAAKLGKHVTLVQLPGKPHDIFLEGAVLAMLAPLLK